MPTLRFKRFFAKSTQEKGWLAIRFLPSGNGGAPESLCLAHIDLAADSKPIVTLCKIHSLDGPNSSALGKLGKSLHLKQYRCTTLLSPDDYQILLAEAPNVPPEELKTAMRWQIKDLLNFRVEDATIDVLDVPPVQGSKRHEVYAVAARNEAVHRRQSLFEEAKIPLSVIDIPETAQRNVAALLETAGQGLALLSFDAEGGLLTFTQGGALYHFRRIEVSLPQLVDPDSERRQRHWEKIVLELQRSFDHFDRNFHFISLKGLVLAPLPNQAELQEHLAGYLYLPVEALNLETVLDLSRVPEMSSLEQQAQCFLTLGAALRLEE